MANSPILFKCVTDVDTHIIPAHNILSMKPILTQDCCGGETYIIVEYYDEEMCIRLSIFCSKVELYSK